MKVELTRPKVSSKIAYFSNITLLDQTLVDSNRKCPIHTHIQTKTNLSEIDPTQTYANPHPKMKDELSGLHVTNKISHGGPRLLACLDH